MEYVEVLLPSVCVAALFYFVMRALLNSDRSERQALAEAEREADQSVAHEALKKPGEEDNK
ncbi:hypothetical protein N2K95_00500 [Arthrobacter zhaoxinii]|uniref:Lysyl-tRNA synthetase n=1 Tax=Arthrobacter zhaoxinii TaxID=2964616 RepID=A0ABY5YT28_9MICC|nr:hypothetical protein [Arthrobacter zhaoxinii]MCQ2000261.1 hypothetical protein [Arthrobacter zhaoxinii]UWX97228.1 hypothetical protein N2K95_00500 [Arthrobacter zhaoxinii]